MDLLVVDHLDAEVLQWLSERHALRYAPELADNAHAFSKAIRHAKALILPASVAFRSKHLPLAPDLLAIGRINGGVENVDEEACLAAGVQVVRSATATAQAEAEFMIGALLTMLRRVPVAAEDGLRVGRELGSCTVGLIGMPPAARAMSSMLAGFRCRVVGYDPSLHASDPSWARWKVEALGLRDLFERCDAVAVQVPYFSRYQGLLGERQLPACKPGQVLVSVSHAGVFQEDALGAVLRSCRMAAAWLDSLTPGATDAGRPLHGLPTLQVTPRLASTTLESRRRSAWAVARRIDAMLGAAPGTTPDFKPTGTGEPADLASAPASP